MTGWRDVVVFADDSPQRFIDKASAALDAAEPYLPLGRLAHMNDSGIGLPITIKWFLPPEHVNWQGQSDYSEIRLNASSLRLDGEWESTLIHEAVHVYDKHCLSTEDHNRVMATVNGCLNSYNGKCVEPLEPVWWDVIYGKSCGELLAFTAAQHIWWVQVKGQANADMTMFGYYKYTPETVPTVMDVLAWTQDKPTQQPQQEEDVPIVKQWLYGEGADLLAAMSAARATGAAVVVKRSEAKALLESGATVTIIGGPACTALGLDWAVAGQSVTQGHITAVLGKDYANGLELVLAH